MSQVFRVGNELLSITKESPPAFKGVLFVCYRGVSPSTVTETVIPLSSIPAESARVDPLTLSPDWVQALRIPSPEPPARSIPRAREKQISQTHDQRANHIEEENGLDRLYRQLSNNPVTCLLLLPFTILIIFVWVVVLICRWAAERCSYAGRSIE